MKYIFKQVDNFTPSETTIEFTADTLSKILEQFEMFLRGSGFQFNGTLDFVQDEFTPDPYVADVGEKPTKEEHEWIQDKRADAEWPFAKIWADKKESIYEGDLNSPSAGATSQSWQGVAPSVAMQWTVKELMKGPLKLNDVVENCSVCGIDKETMKNQKCWDKFCPKGNDAY